MSFVFLSHSSSDNAQALALAQWLEGNGWADYFLDISETRGLVSGEQWQNALKNASHRCEAVIFVISRAWNDSKWCLSEFLLAKQLGKQIFGVLIEDIPLGELPLELTSEYQLCDLVHGDSRVAFDVEREPFVAPTRLDLPEVGLNALKRGLQNAGLEATTFPWPPADESARAPYRGLKPYEAKDAAIFFGRDAAIVRGLDQVRQLRDHRVDKLLVILGSSGAGKSSFMRAGLWPRLERDDHHFYPLPVVRPAGAAINGEEGLVNCLATALADVGITTVARGEIRTRFKTERSGEALMGYLQHLRDALVARAVADTPEPTFILPIDQGEELYASDGAEEARQLRVQLGCLRKRHDTPLGEQEGPNILAMVTIRTDLYVHLQTDELLQDVGRQMVDLTPMDRAEYRRIIEGPAERATEAGKALVIEPALTEQLLTETHGADALPMLAFTLERLYNDYGGDGDLTLEEYHQMGGVTGSLTAAIDAAMGAPQNAPVIPTDKVAQQRLLKQAFIPWLAEVDEQSGERRRRVASWDEMPAETHPMLERLTHARLLVRDLRGAGDTEDKREVAEVAHEALLRRWPALVDWLDADQDALKAVGSVSRAAAHWAQNHQDDEYLIHAGERLRYAETLLEREDFTQRLGDTGRAYLARCRAVEDERAANEKKQRRRLRGAFVAAVLLAIVAVVGAGLAYKSSLEATRNAADARAAEGEAVAEKKRADEARVAADEKAAEAIRERDQGLRTLSLMHADFSRQQTDEGFATLGVLLALEALPKSIDAPERPYVPEAEGALSAALDALFERSTLKGHEGEVYSVAFSPDGTQVVTASGDGTARVWDVASGKELAVLEGVFEGDEGYPVENAEFSADGSRILGEISYNAARLWDAMSGAQVAVLKGWNAAFSPDGTRVVTSKVSTPRTDNHGWLDDNTARLWDAVTGVELAVLRGHEDGLNSAAFSPDGTRVVTASTDNTARVWDPASGAELAVLEGHEAFIASAAFSPDGTQVLTASRDGTARLWDAASGVAVAVLMTHEGKSNSVTAAFSPDGTLVVTASADNTARVWDAGSGEQIAVLEGHDAAFSPDGTRLVTTSRDNTARVWDAASGEAVAVVDGVARMDGAVGVSAVFSPDSTRVVTASADNTARVWDAASGAQVAKLTGHEGPVNAAAFSPDGARVVTASRDNTARVWDAASGARPYVPKFYDGPEVRLVVAFSPDRIRVVTSKPRDGTARLWNEASGTEVAVLEGHEGPITGAAFSPDGTRLVTASADNTARVWDGASGELVAVLKGHEDSVSVQTYGGQLRFTPLSAAFSPLSAAFSPDGTQVLTASRDGTARLWDAASGEAVAVLKAHEGEAQDGTAAFSPDGTRIVTYFDGDTPRLWDAGSGEQIAVLEDHEDNVTSAAFSPDGTRVVTASFDETPRLWDAVSGDHVAVLKGHEGPVTSAAFSPDGTRLVTASADNTARVWDAGSGEVVAVLQSHEGSAFGASEDGSTEDGVISAAFSPDGSRVLTAALDATARLWDAASGAELAVLRGGEGFFVGSAAFSADGTRVVTASLDGIARLWDAASGVKLAVLQGHRGVVKSAAFSPEGTRVVTASYDNSVRWWDLVSTQALIDRARERLPRKALTEAERKKFFVPSE